MSISVNHLPAATGVNGSDNVLVVQGGVTKRAAVSLFGAGKQAADASLTALSALSGTGFLRYDGSDTFTCVTFTSAGVALATAASAAAQRTALGLGTGAVKDSPASGNATSGQVVLGSDTRLSDSRTPATHTHTLSAITDAGTAAAKNIPASGDASSSQVVYGTDTRLTDTRTPSAHKTSHQTGGSDPITAAMVGAASTTHTHVASDVTNLGTSAVKNVPASGNAGVGEVVLGSDTRLSDTRVPTSHTHTLSGITDAGTAAAKNIPVSGNATGTQVVYGTDTRLADSRAPTAHKTSHATGGSDALTYTDVGAAAASHTHSLSAVTDAGTMAAQNAAAVAITGGTITGVAITSSSIDGLDFLGFVSLLQASLGTADTVTAANTAIAFLTTAAVTVVPLEGDALRITARGVFSTSSASSQTVQFRVKLGSTVIATFPAVAAASSLTNAAWSLSVDVIVDTDGVSGAIDAQGTLQVLNAVSGNLSITAFCANTSLVSVDLTGDLDVSLTTQWGATDASSSASVRQLVAVHMKANV